MVRLGPEAMESLIVSLQEENAKLRAILIMKAPNSLQHGGVLKASMEDAARTLISNERAKKQKSSEKLCSYEQVKSQGSPSP